MPYSEVHIDFRELIRYYAELASLPLGAFLHIDIHNLRAIMSKSNFLENAILALLFNGTGIANMADNAGVAPLTNLYVSLHTADPGEAGTQSTSEIAYTNYARVAVARTAEGWQVTGNAVSPAANIDFPTGTGGGGTATHFGIGTAQNGAGTLLYSGTVTPNIVCGNGITPRLSTTGTITED